METDSVSSSLLVSGNSEIPLIAGTTGPKFTAGRSSRWKSPPFFITSRRCCGESQISNVNFSFSDPKQWKPHSGTHPNFLRSSQQWFEKKYCVVFAKLCVYGHSETAGAHHPAVINVSLITKISEWLVFVISPCPEDEEHGPGGAEHRPQVAAGCDLAGSRGQQKQLCGVQQR